MKKSFGLQLAGLVIIVIVSAEILVAQRSRNLIINGKNAGPVVQMRGRSYVDIETLAQNTNASVNFQPDRIILTLPVSGGANAQTQPGLSKEFASAALGSLALMREWKSAVETMITFRVPVTGTWLQDYHDRAEEALKMASVAASNPLDQNTLQLLQNEFSTLSGWAGSAIAARQALNATRTLGPDVLQNDQVLQKINTCSNFLGGLLVSGNFSDNPACH
ncbi:MAG: hypothetical protein HYX72_09055 [Acidobacteria bacterium]|nr:hypothetical protein [Acidobacteriota bacterium]